MTRATSAFQLAQLLGLAFVSVPVYDGGLEPIDAVIALDRSGADGALELLFSGLRLPRPSSA